MSQTILQPQPKKITQLQPLIITSPAFQRGDLISSRYTLEGKNVPPPLRIMQIPAGAATLAVVMTESGEASDGRTRWIAWNITPATYLTENLRQCTTGKNDHGVRYTGPTATFAKHKFTITVFALDIWLRLGSEADYRQLEKAMAGHIIASGQTNFKYRRYDRHFRHLL